MEEVRISLINLRATFEKYFHFKHILASKMDEAQIWQLPLSLQIQYEITRIKQRSELKDFLNCFFIYYATAVYKKVTRNKFWFSQNL